MPLSCQYFLLLPCQWDQHGNGRVYWWIPGVNIHPLHMGLNGRTVTENFLSAPLSHYDIILGESWLQENSGIMDYAHGQLWQWTPTGIQKM